jgi:hypothetical protein
VPFNKGGHYIAPRTVLKVIAWGNFVCYSNKKMAFSNIMPVEDLGLPLGYKSTKASIREALKQVEDMRNKSRESDYDRKLVLKSL